MSYITDYQLDIYRGFMCKVNEKVFKIMFNPSNDGEHWFLTQQFEQLLIELKLNHNSVVKSYGTFEKNHLVYCNSRQQCYDLCQHIVDTYFMPNPFTKNDEEVCEKSRRYLAKYYADDQYRINLPERSFSLRRYNGNTWYWHNNNLTNPSNCIYSQFRVSKSQVLEICNKLNLSCILYATVPTFENPNDAIKFTDYLIETYIIKKEKTYDTNRLRKERTSLSRGAKPAGNIIHGRRSKASVRCRHIEYKARIGC